jgi:hypothetical protein
MTIWVAIYQSMWVAGWASQTFVPTRGIGPMSPSWRYFEIIDRMSADGFRMGGAQP